MTFQKREQGNNKECEILFFFLSFWKNFRDLVLLNLIDSLTHNIVKVERQLWRTSSSTTCSKEGQLQQQVEGNRLPRIDWGFEHVQGLKGLWKLLPCLITFTVNYYFFLFKWNFLCSHSYTGPLSLDFRLLCSHTPTCHLLFIRPFKIYKAI